MTEDNEPIRSEEEIKAMAQRAALYYRTLIKSEVPDDLARALTEQFHDHQLQLASGKQVMSSFGTRLIQRKLES